MKAPEPRHAIGTDLPLPLTVSMRRGHLIVHTVIVLAGVAVLLSRLREQRDAVSPGWVVLICAVSAVLLAMTRIVILRQDGIYIRRVWPTKRVIPYGSISEVEPRTRALRLTLSDGSDVRFPLTLPVEHQKLVLNWLRGQARAATFD